MPLSPAPLSQFYHQLAQQLSAGLTLAQALRAPSSAPAADTLRLAALAESGVSIPEIIATAGNWLPASDRPFLAAAAQSGRLPRVLTNLAERHAQVAQTRRRVALACLYPVGVFHFAAVIYPLLRLINFETGLNWSLSAYLGGLLAILLPAWGAVIILWILVRRENPAALALLNILPAIGGYRKHQALADFAFALGNLLEGGAPIGRAWLTAGGLARSPRIAAAAQTIHTRIEHGEAPGPHLLGTQAFPPEFVARYQTGETTGSLDNVLLALATDHQATANRHLTAATMLYPAVLFGCVALMVAWIVLSFAMQYYGKINSMMDGM
ncbi:MAG: type II secretion system F family protein [Rariglobus sp.]|nr:type II secretion system F family protein [Rariglobus sp.]